MEAHYLYAALVALLTVAVVCGKPEPHPEVCSLPKVEGECRALTTRVYFDPKTGCCRKFSYTGCGANGNNFTSKRQCRSACPETSCERANRRRRNQRGGRNGAGKGKPAA